MVLDTGPVQDLTTTNPKEHRQYGLDPPIDGKQYAGQCVRLENDERVLAAGFDSASFIIPEGTIAISARSPFTLVYEDLEATSTSKLSLTDGDEDLHHQVVLTDHTRLQCHKRVEVHLIDPLVDTGETLETITIRRGYYYAVKAPFNLFRGFSEPFRYNTFTTVRTLMPPETETRVVSINRITKIGIFLLHSK